ncbi:4-aminobutyrate--2-oxoglutarate transaminase [Pseudomonadales bacterium]|nr:4-aminobutyrate--2-oxoglutarate transaminase [Pseudomonadales bacterium]MDB2410694.1 4-aminobutyrate--2-oxoglutarate transaminase [Pseudomonadales bacterium]
MSVSKSNTNQASNTEWQKRKEAAFARGLSNVAPVYVERARGSEIWDVEGNRYIDFATGIAVCNTGHSHPHIVAAVKDQVDRFSHTCLMVSPYDSAVVLAEKLNQLAPGDSVKKTLLVTTGAEAVENCVKIARAHTGRRGVIAFNGGYHGRTLMTMSLTGKITPYKNLFGPFPGEIFHAPFPIATQGVSIEDALKGLDNLFKVDIAPSDVAAFIVEPVQGEGGFYPAPDAFLQALRKLADQHGILLICDEVQSGFGRTGKFFASEHAGIEPDLISVAKGIAGGFPLAGVIGKADIMDAPLPSGLGGTYAGSPVSCAAALAVLDVIEQEGLVTQANHIGKYFGRRLNELQKNHRDIIAEVRVDRGAMIAIELMHDGDRSRPNPELTRALVAEAHRQGLILLSCGFHGNVIRCLPALTISDELIDEGMTILANSLEILTADH